MVNDTNDLIEAALAQADEWALDGGWEDAAALLHAVRPAAAEKGPRDEARILVALLRMRNFQDLIQGPTHSPEKAAALDRLHALAEQLGDARMLADALHERGVDLHMRYFADDGDLAAERELLTRALALRREAGDEAGVGWSLIYLATIDQIEIDHGAGLATFEEALAIATRLNDPLLASYATRHIGYARQHRGELDAAEAAFAASLAQREKVRWSAGTFTAHHTLGALLRARHELGRAREHLERARELGERLGAGGILDAVREELAACQG
jgi:tetratricopeptide (TPR) repeat protein